MRRIALALAAQAIASTAAAQEADPDRLIAQDARLAAVSFRLARANVETCPQTEIVAGWSLHDLAQYAPDEREGVARRFGMDPRLPSILALAPNGPAAAAGLEAGDVLMAVNDRRLDEALPAHPSHAPLARQAAALDAALLAGPLRLTVRRRGLTQVVSLTGVGACTVRPEIVLSDELVAKSEGPVVQVSLRLAEYARDDAELAFIVGHEMAHAILDRHKGAEAEQEADALALRLMARAGYAPRAAAAFWARLATDYPATEIDQADHPPASARRAALEAQAAEIEASRAP